MVPLDTRKRLSSGLAALLLAALVLGACRSAATATPTAPPDATATQGEGNGAEDPTDVPPPTEDTSILFQDDFSDDDSGWLVVQGQGALASYQNPEVYRLDVIATQTLLTAARPGAFSDFSLETIVSGSGSGGQFRYGLVFRQITADNYYAAFVNPATQGYLIAKRLLGEWSTLAEGQNAAIPTTGDPVTLRLDAQGPNLTFSINGVGLVTLVDTSFAAGDVGYAAETLDGASVRLDANSIIIRRFNPDTVPSAPTAVPVIATATETPSVTDTPTVPPPTTSAISSAQPPATQAVPSTQAIQATVSSAGTALAATAGAAATQACALLGCP